MQITSYNYDQLVDEARKELREITTTGEPLDEEQRQQIEIIFDAFIQLYNERSNWGYQNTFSFTLNNLSDKIYNDFQVLAKKTGIPLHQLFNILMNEFVLKPGADITAEILKPYYSPKTKYSVNHHKKLTITKDDLKELDGPISINHIGILNFDSEVDEKLFIEKVQSVNHCKLVDYPSNFSKMLVLMKTRFCDKITFSS